MRILVLDEKHGTTFLNASTVSKLHEAALSVVKSRLDPEWGWYAEDDPGYKQIKKAADTNDGKLAWQILQSRSDWEYEGVYLAEVKDKYGEEK